MDNKLENGIYYAVSNLNHGTERNSKSGSGYRLPYLQHRDYFLLKKAQKAYKSFKNVTKFDPKMAYKCIWAHLQEEMCNVAVLIGPSPYPGYKTILVFSFHGEIMLFIVVNFGY